MSSPLLQLNEIDERITRIKNMLQDQLLILGHHYQSDEVIKHADSRGDSFILARHAASKKQVRYIVFCGVHFMAETADVLTSPEQEVFLPDLDAGCPMADMAPLDKVETCWQHLTEIFPGDQLIPITYVNSSAALKAFCGRHGGLVCTSSTSVAAVKWALKQDKRVLFLPDYHLGYNTARYLGLSPSEVASWNRCENTFTGEPDRARIILWDGYCPVHIGFKTADIKRVREEHPGIRIIVHPECPADLVSLADAWGSTERIIEQVSNSQPGSIWAIGTEINLVNRLAQIHKDKTILYLSPQVPPCADMAKITPLKLLQCLENIIDQNPANRITVDRETKSQAALALKRMLSLQ